jgi:hypothetical protein
MFVASYPRLFREYDSQPQVILGSALYSLRYMPVSLWDEVYSEIMSSADIITEDYNQTKSTIISWLVLLGPHQFELVSPNIVYIVYTYANIDPDEYCLYYSDSRYF